MLGGWDRHGPGGSSSLGLEGFCRVAVTTCWEEGMEVARQCPVKRTALRGRRSGTGVLDSVLQKVDPRMGGILTTFPSL